MDKKMLSRQLRDECGKRDPDLKTIHELLLVGTDVNEKDEYGRNIVYGAIENKLWNICDAEDAQRRKASKPETYQKIRRIAAFLTEHLNDAPQQIGEFLSKFIYSVYDEEMFRMFSFLLNLLPAEADEAYEELLRAVGTEESYQRVCEKNHRAENIFYAMYEKMLAKKEGRRADSIDVYFGAAGMRIDNILYFDKSDTTVKKRKHLFSRKAHTEYNADIGFVCGDRLLVLRKEVNVLFMDDRAKEEPYIERPDLFGVSVLGTVITDISFSHRQMWKEEVGYGQPTLTMSLNNGVKLNFTHNFGERTGKEIQPRFYVN